MSVTQVADLWEEFTRRLEEVSNLDQLAELRDRFLSRHRGVVTLELKQMGKLPARERRERGRQLNELKERVEEALGRRREELERMAEGARLEQERVDVSLPGYPFFRGGIHPLRRIRQEMEEIAVRMGFSVVSGPEIEEDYYNFEALNMPRGHPARDSQDSFYITENLLLRTHTSPVQIRTMERHQPPIRIVVPGRVFRRDAVDATHSPMFHQLEGLVVDEGITLADLIGTLEAFCQGLFSPDTRIRLRPSYFPFVEPGAEVDISCIFCSGQGCRLCKHSGWIEILGAGMVHRRVFEMVGYDPERYTGFAWGMGIDRVALLKYEINDIRLLFENDVRFLRQFSF